MPDHRPTLLFTEDLTPADLEIIETEAARTGFAWRQATADPLADQVADVAAIVTKDRDIDATTVAAAPALSLILTIDLGAAVVDHAAAAGRGVAVANLVNLGWLGVSEHTVLLMLALVKRLPEAHTRTAAGERKPGASEVRTTARDYTFSWLGQENLGWLYRKRLGLVGVGRIGKGVAERARAFGMRIHYAAPRRLDPETERQYGLEYAALDDLLGWADIVSVHARLTPENERMFGAREFGLMRPDAWFINTARGALVDESALVDALRSRSIAGAGLDVFDYEPIRRDNPLLTLDNVILTPHSAGIFNDDARAAQLREAFDRVAERPDQHGG